MPSRQDRFHIFILFMIVAMFVVHASSCCLSKPVVENARGFDQQWHKPYPSNTSQARLRASEGEPLIEQADAIAPSFEILAAFQGPVTTGADFGAGDPAVVLREEERRICFVHLFRARVM